MSDEARRLYEKFTGRKHTRTEILDVPDEFAHIGKVVLLCYLTKEGKKMVRYVHDFENPLPDLLVGNRDREGTAIITGSFRFSSRGFIG